MSTQQLADYIDVLIRRRRTAAIAAALALLLGLGLAVAKGRTWHVSSTILVMNFDRSGTSLPLMPGGGPSPGGLAAALGAANRPDPIQALLHSRTLRARVATHLDPKAKQDVPDPLKAAGYSLAIGEGAGSSITITVGARDSISAAKANDLVVEELRSLLTENAITDTKRQRVFTEQLLEENTTRRRELEEALMGFSPDGTISLDPEMATLLARASAIREKNASRRLSASALGSPTEAATTLQEMEKLQSDVLRIAKTPSSNSTVVPLARVPLLALEFRRHHAELRLLDEVHALLRSQRELALIQEARDTPSFTVIDPANAATASPTPRLRQVALVSVLSALLVGLGAAFTHEWAKLPGNPFFRRARHLEGIPARP